MAVAELEVVIMHAQCRAEQVAHVGRSAAGKVNVVGKSEGRFLVHPLDHGSVAAHHAVHVPISGSVFKSHFAQSLDRHC